MSNYQILIDDSFQFNIFEKNTNQIIKTFFFEDDAKDYLKFLDRGGAFNGWTPHFMLLKVNIIKDINDEFDNILDDLDMT